jgi:adenylate kinase family enzyme
MNNEELIKGLPLTAEQAETLKKKIKESKDKVDLKDLSLTPPQEEILQLRIKEMKTQEQPAVAQKDKKVVM